MVLVKTQHDFFLQECPEKATRLYISSQNEGTVITSFVYENSLREKENRRTPKTPTFIEFLNAHHISTKCGAYEGKA